ncbi:unnamed protein product [Durusdinium trenchii]|uniref:Uncharacterized protein n=2 Tax=Durusdinium trenchii TaxID=1381693 RepID=A0ABP0HJ23_9DINO
MQIGNIALSSHQASPFYQNVLVLSIKWYDHATLHGPDTVIYIDYDEVEAIATIIIIAPPLFDIIEDHWAQAWDKMDYNVAKEIADSADTQSKGSGKGKVQLQSSKKALEDLEKDKIAAAQLRAQSGQLQVEVQTAQQALEAQLQNTKQTLEELEMERQKSRQLEVQLESMKQALEEHASARDQGKRCKEALEAVERKQSELLAEKEKEQTQAECRIAELLDKVKELEGSSMADEEKILEPSVRPVLDVRRSKRRGFETRAAKVAANLEHSKDRERSRKTEKTKAETAKALPEAKVAETTGAELAEIAAAAEVKARKEAAQMAEAMSEAIAEARRRTAAEAHMAKVMAQEDAEAKTAVAGLMARVEAAEAKAIAVSAIEAKLREELAAAQAEATSAEGAKTEVANLLKEQTEQFETLRHELCAREELNAMLKAEVVREEAATDHQAVDRSTKQLEEAQEALASARRASQAALEAELQVEEAKLSVGQQTVAGEALVRAAENVPEGPESNVACNLWSMAAQARASEGVLATRGPGGQMLLSDSRRAETAEARLRARCLVGSAELHYERAEQELQRAQREQQRLGLLAQELANSAAQHAQHELQLAQRRWAMAEQHRVRARELKEETVAFQKDDLEQPSEPPRQDLPRLATLAPLPVAAAAAVEEESERRQAAAELYAQARLHRDLEMAVAEARQKLQRRQTANQHRAEAEVARCENEELQASLERLKPEGPPPGHLAFALREALGCWAKRRRLCEQVLDGMARTGLAHAAEEAGIVTDESCGQHLPQGRLDPVLGRVPLLLEEQALDGIDNAW